MDRYDELTKKRDDVGLSREEASELGRLEAERRGREYEGNAANPPPEVQARRRSRDPAEYVAELEEQERDVDDSIQTEPRKAGEQVDVPPPA